MTASVTITAARKAEALRVANAALRWKADETSASQEPAQQQRQGPGPQARTASAASVERAKPPGSRRPAVPLACTSCRTDKPVPVSIRVGLSDGQRTEVLEGLAEGDRVIVGGGEAGASGPQQRRRGPF